MKKLILTVVGIFLIILSNTIINFIPIRLFIEPIFIYIVLVSIYSDQNKYFLYFLSALLGFLQDSSISMYSGVYTMLFIIIMIVGNYLHDKIRKEYFSTSFMLCFIFVILSNIYLGLISRNIILESNLVYTIHTMLIIAISIVSINNIRKKLEN